VPLKTIWKKMLRRLLSTLIVAGLVFGCSQESKDFGDYKLVKVSGTIQQVQEQSVILYKIGGLRPEAVDTAEVASDGTFTIEVLVTEPEIYVLDIYGLHIVPLVLEDNDLDLVANGADRTEIVSVSGSDAMEKLTLFNKEYRELEIREFELRQKYSEAFVAKDIALTEKLEKENYEIIEEKQDLIRKHMEIIGPSLAALPLIERIDKDLHFDYLLSISNEMLQKYPEHSEVKSLAQVLEKMKPVAIGRQAPQIKLPNTEGEMVSLEDFRGDYLLVDFWAAWCKPCRRENPNIVAAYQKYHDKGFDVLGVSLDRTREQWIKAIVDDGLPWTQVSDLKYFNSKAAADYNVGAIPFSVLLNPEGEIIAKNLRGAKLEAKLSELFEGS